MSFVSDYNTLKSNLVSTLAIESNKFYHRYINGVVNVYQKIIYILLVKYINLILEEDVYEEHINSVLYVVGNYVSDGDDFYICIKDLTSAGILLTNTEFWAKSIAITYSEDDINTAIIDINRICNTNYYIDYANTSGDFDLDKPVLFSIEIGDGTDDEVILTYNESLDESSTPSIGDYSITGTSETITSVLVSGRLVTLTLSGDALVDDVLYLSYTGGTNPIRDLVENEADDFTNTPISNSITDYLKDHDGVYILDHEGNKIPV